MNVAIFLGHPAHFHLFKNTAYNLLSEGNNVCFVIKKKDILVNLLSDSGLTYHVISEGRTNGKSGLIKSVLHMEKEMSRFIRKNKVNILIGSTLSFATRLLTKSKVIVTGEDDAAIIPFYANLVFPFANEILTPVSCDNGRWNNKSIKYQSFQKLAYLHPKYFTPDRDIVSKYFSPEKPYFLLRFAKLSAHHDSGVEGINTEIAHHLIELLKPYGDIYITAERTLESQFEKYRLNINPLDIHHIMAFSKIYIGDSQSMAVEAAMLGVPSIRFNSFAGKIGVLEELEQRYGLTFGINSALPDKLYEKVKELLDINNINAEFQQRRERMLSEKIDLTAFYTWFVKNYPTSKKIMKENPDYQYTFK